LVKGSLASQQPRLQPPGLWSVYERDVNRPWLRLAVIFSNNPL
jgi:hypothetical protein